LLALDAKEMITSAPADDGTPFRIGNYEFGGIEIFLAGCVVFIIIGIIQGYREERREKLRVTNPRKYLERWARRNAFEEVSTSLVELAMPCSRCHQPLHGLRLESSAVKSDKPPPSWRVCYSCGLRECVFSEYPWLRTHVEDIESHKRRERERERIDDFLHRKHLRQQSTFAGWKTMSPKDFEYAVAEILRANGYQDVLVCGGAGDLSVDITCRDPAGEPLAVQCKRYVDKPVGSKEMQTFIGMLHAHHQMERGMYVTTSRYTRPAQELADNHEIELIDKDDLVELASILRPTIEKNEEKEIRSLEMWKVIQDEREAWRQEILRKAEEERRARAREWAYSGRRRHYS